MIWAKVIASALAFIASYALLGLADLSPPAFLAVYLLHGMVHFYILLNIGHDANHMAIARDDRIGRILRYSMDLCGISSYLWRIVHHKGHHFCVNVRGHDEAILGRGIFRFSPDEPARPMMRFQHLYALPCYMVASLDYVFVKDFEHLLAPKIALLRTARHRWQDIALLVGFKGAYVLYTLVLPIFVFGYDAALVLAGFLIAHAFIGLLALIVFQTTHLVDLTAFPDRPCDHDSFVAHMLATTKDVAPESRGMNLWTGGLNAHAIHHLMPGIVHTHYPELSRILRETAAEHAVAYRMNETLGDALVEHLRLMRRLAVGDAPRLPVTAH